MFFKWYHIVTAAVLFGVFKALATSGQLPPHVADMPAPIVIVISFIAASLLWHRD